MAKDTYHNTSKNRRVGLLRVLLVTLLCLIPIRLFLIGTYYVGSAVCTDPEFNHKSLLFVSLIPTSRFAGDRYIFAYTDSLQQPRLAPAVLLSSPTADTDSVMIQTCSDTLYIHSGALHGEIIGTLHIGF